MSYDNPNQDENEGYQSERRCVLHPDRPALYTAQGILCCAECWERYVSERRESNGDYNRRPFLHQLIKVRHEI